MRRLVELEEGERPYWMAGTRADDDSPLAQTLAACDQADLYEWDSIFTNE